MSDVYAYWRAALAGKSEQELAPLRLPTVGEGTGEDPQPGLWKVRLSKGAAPVLMQIWLAEPNGKPAYQWQPGLKLLAMIGQREPPLMEVCERWLFVEPATKEAAACWRQHGHWLGDAPPLAARSNMPADPFEALKSEADDRLEQAQQWLHLHAPIQGQTDSDIATNMAAELLALNKRADSMHEAEKRPHLEAGRAVDAKFRFREQLATWVANLKSASGMWMAAEERRRQEERDKAYREQLAVAEAERERVQAVAGPECELPPLPPTPEPVKMQSGGGAGRRSGLKTDWEFEIVDYRLAALRVIDDPEVSIAVGKVLKRLIKAAKGKVDIPGVKIKEVRKAA